MYNMYIENMNVLLTCPPMILRLSHCKKELEEYNVFVPDFTQVMTEDELIKIIHKYDAWIVGDDPCTRKVLERGKNLKVVIKWGIGTDNIDFDAIKDLNLKFSNTPGMFGNEVADVAIGYLIGITRHLFEINNQVKMGKWIKPSGISLKDKRVTLIGFGDIGRNIASRLLSLNTHVYVSDPGFNQDEYGKITCIYNDNIIIEEHLYNVKLDTLQNCLKDSRIVIIACPSIPQTFHLINKDTIDIMADECYIINVSRGSIVKEEDVVSAFESGKLSGFASDVFENEPISLHNKLLNFNTIVGSHNASNTVDAVDRTNVKVVHLLNEMLN